MAVVVCAVVRLVVGERRCCLGCRRKSEANCCCALRPKVGAALTTGTCLHSAAATLHVLRPAAYMFTRIASGLLLGEKGDPAAVGFGSCPYIMPLHSCKLTGVESSGFAGATEHMHKPATEAKCLHATQPQNTMMQLPPPTWYAVCHSERPAAAACAKEGTFLHVLT